MQLRMLLLYPDNGFRAARKFIRSETKNEEEQ